MFQIISWFGTDLNEQDAAQLQTGDDGEDNESSGRSSAYAIKMFGVSPAGQSVSVTASGFRPYFYVRVPEEMQGVPRSVHKILPRALHDLCSNEYACCRRSKDALHEIRPVKKKNFWGFTNGRKEWYMCLIFRKLSSMRQMARYLEHNPVKIRGHGEYKLQLFESNIDPLLRFLHEQDLDAAGWAKISARDLSTASACEALCVTEHVHIDTCVPWNCVHPCKNGENIAPLLVAAFDIESNSSHGDFSLAIKKYKRVANDITRFYDEIIAKNMLSEYESKHLLERCIRYACWQNDDGHEEREEGRAETETEACSVPAGAGTETDTDTGGTRGGEEGGEKLRMDHAADIRDIMARVIFKQRRSGDNKSRKPISDDKIASVVDDAYSVLCGKRGDVRKASRISVISDLFSETWFPELEGDEVIQIGTTFHIYGQTDCCYRHIVTLGDCEDISSVSSATSSDSKGKNGVITDTISCRTEQEVLLCWVEMMRRLDPDVVTGYNIFGFDIAYMVDRSRELGIERAFLRLGRLRDYASEYKEATISSSALGDNLLKYVDMQGRTLMDIMKVVQRDHKLDSWKLDNVAHHFTGKKKNDISAQDIFRLQRGSANDRRIIAEYCLQDCVLCNHLVMRLEIVANNLGMANVCSVPLSYIFMRGQGVKIFSLVAKQCRLDNFVIPVIKKRQGEDDDNGYEGAIVLEPKAGMYLDDPVTVLDYASLYPSSMISENISHDCLVMDDAKYGNLPDVTYESIGYDTPEGRHVCKFAQIPGKGVLPRILQQLLRARKSTRKKIPLQALELPGGNDVLKGSYVAEEEQFVEFDNGKEHAVSKEDAASYVKPLYNDFQKAILDGLQNAYKVTANSLYGQMGASTSPLYLKHVAACTTSTGRSLILRAKAFMESRLNVNVIYGDTDSLFMIFDMRDETTGEKLTGKAALIRSIEMAHRASELYKPELKAPHDLEYDKTFWPFVIFSKKRYVGNLYEEDVNKCKRKEMGIVLKRRDNAHIVKHIYGGIIDIILNRCDVPESVRFLRACLDDLVGLRTPKEELVITKTLGGTYKDPEKCAHWVLAQRIGEREPGNKPQANDRIPFMYIQVPPETMAKSGGSVLQGDRIEDPGYAERNGLKPDVEFYITNQIMKPVLQLYSIVLEQIDGYRHRESGYWESVMLSLLEKYEGDYKKARSKYDEIREKEVKTLLFDPFLHDISRRKNGTRSISSYMIKKTEPSSSSVKTIVDGHETANKESPPPPTKTMDRTIFNVDTSDTSERHAVATKTIPPPPPPPPQRKRQQQTSIQSFFNKGRGGNNKDKTATSPPSGGRSKKNPLQKLKDERMMAESERSVVERARREASLQSSPSSSACSLKE